MSILKWFGIIALVASFLIGGCILAALRDTSLRIAQLERESLLVATRHGPIEYKVWGSGPPVLVVHGAGGGFDQGALLARTLGGQGFTWIAISRFGYLRSAMPEHASPAAQAEAMIDLLEHLGIERASVLAMSGGVPPALQFAAMFPERTGTMVLLSSAPFTPFGPDVDDRPLPTAAYSVILGNDVIYWGLTRVARGALEAAFDARPELRVEGSSEEIFIRNLIDTFLPASRRVPGVLNEGAAVDPSETFDLEAIKAPVLVVHARDDRLNPHAVGEAIASRIDGARFLSFDSGGHLLLGHHGALREQIGATLGFPQVD